MRLLAIDFGTSNTVAALLVDGQAARTVTFDTSPLLPSAVYLGADGQMTVGREAQRQARLDPSRYEPNPKRRIDDGEILLGDRVVPVIDVIGAVLRTVATEVRRQLGGQAPDEVRLTHPAQWGASRQNVLVSAARAAGLGTRLVLIPEPVAAAAQFTQLPGRTLPPGGTVAVYDLGGGTFDIAVVGRTQNQGGANAEFHVLAEAGLADLGGLDFDRAVLDQVGRTTSATDPARWQQFLRPADASARRAARALAEDVRAAKETLSRYPQTDVSLPDPFVDAHLTRTEFEGLIRPNLLRSIEVLSSTLRSAGLEPERLNGIFLVGGSSRIPLVAALIQDRLHVIPVALDQPETAVALGALLVPVRREGNRTAAMTGNAPRPMPPQQQTGPRPPASPGAGGGAATGPDTGSRRQTAPPPPTAGPPTVGPPTVDRKRKVVIGGAIAVVGLIVAIILIVAKPFSGATVADTQTTGTSPATAPSLISTGSSGTASTAAAPTSGLGPNKVFTSGEVAFMGPALNSLSNCSDATSAFNAAVAAAFQVGRATRCEVLSDADKLSLTGRTFVYVMTPKTGAAPYLDQIAANRKPDKYGMSKYDTDDSFKAGSITGRSLTGVNVPALGVQTTGAGFSVLAWNFTGQPYVGVVVTLSVNSQSDLTSYWAANFKPRG